MIIKKFQGKTEQEATALAKKELGENAVIMHVRTVKRKGLLKLFKKPYVEVSAALEEEADTSFAKMKEAVSEVAKAVGKVNDMETAAESTSDNSSVNTLKQDADYSAKQDPGNIEEKLESLHNLLIEKKLIDDRKTELKDIETDARSTDFFKLIYNTLIDNEVDEKYVNDIIDEAVKIYKPNSQIDYILANIYQRMVLKFGKVSLITDAEKGPKVLFFIGPTGVGKTTTIAKLASKLKVNDKKKIVLLTTDTYRIAAAEQLKTYANILEVPFKVIYSPEELVSAISDFSESDYILIDTAGHAHTIESQ